MKNLFLLLISCTLIIFSNCSKNKDKTQYKGKIKGKKEFISFLIDLHKTDGILITANLDDYNLNDHTVNSYYNYILRKHKLNYVDFKRSLDYYMDDIDKFSYMYKIIIDSLKNEMAYLDSLQRKKISKPNLWPGKTIYLIPFQDNTEDSIPFEIKNIKPGVYELSANIKVFRDDRTKNLKMRMMVEYEDNTIDTSETKIYFKDNQFHKYIVKLYIKDNPKPKRIFGNLLTYKSTIYMHIQIKQIHLFYFTKEEMPWHAPNVKQQINLD